MFRWGKVSIPVAVMATGFMFWQAGVSAGRSAPTQADVSADQVKTAKGVLGDNCVGCHKVGDMGSSDAKAPDLSHEGAKRTADWISVQIKDPASHNKETQMPSFDDIPKADREATAAYLASLK